MHPSPHVLFVRWWLVNKIRGWVVWLINCASMRWTGRLYGNMMRLVLVKAVGVAPMCVHTARCHFKMVAEYYYKKYVQFSSNQERKKYK